MPYTPPPYKKKISESQNDIGRKLKNVQDNLECTEI